jgi:hypothetical protein
MPYLFYNDLHKRNMKELKYYFIYKNDKTSIFFFFDKKIGFL